MEHSCSACRAANLGEEMQWYAQVKWMTYNVGLYAALGDLLTQKDLENLFPHADILGRAMFASVRAHTPDSYM